MAPYPDAHAAVATGARAAGLLEAAFDRTLIQPDDRRMELVRDLVRDIKGQLEALAYLATPMPFPDLMAEAALRCADLASLAACNLDGLPAPDAARAGAGVHLVAGAVQALRLLSEGSTGDFSETHPDTLRDTRGAGWRVNLAVRQMEEFLEAAPES